MNKISLTDILHRTTYIWKEDLGCSIIINTEGNKVILNQKSSQIWKEINDESSVSQILSSCNELSQNEGLSIIEDLLDSGLVTNEELFFLGGCDL